MKMLLLTVSALLLSPVGLFAADIAALQSFRAADTALSRASVAAVPPPAAVSEEHYEQNFRAVDKCWARGADQEADAMGLPRSFCVKRVGMEVPVRTRDIFDYKSSMLVEDKAGVKRLHISGYSKKGEETRTVVGTIFESGRDARVFAAIYFDSSLEGEVRPSRPEVRGFIMRPSGAAREILYAPSAK